MKDNKYELIQIDTTSPDLVPLNDAILYYLNQAAINLELMTGTEHPMVAEIYSKISLRYAELDKDFLSLNWMRKAYCIFFATLGIFDPVVKRCYDYLRRKEINFSTEFQNMGSEQYCNALIEKFASGELEILYEDEEDIEISNPGPNALRGAQPLKAIQYGGSSNPTSKAITDRTKTLSTNRAPAIAY